MRRKIESTRGQVKKKRRKPKEHSTIPKHEATEVRQLGRNQTGELVSIDGPDEKSVSCIGKRAEQKRRTGLAT